MIAVVSPYQYGIDTLEVSKEDKSNSFKFHLTNMGLIQFIPSLLKLSAISFHLTNMGLIRSVNL